MAGRNSKLQDPEFCKLVAEMFARGENRDDMAEALDCHRDTISKWVRDPRVQAHVTRLTTERVNRIARRIDSEMEARLAHLGTWKIEDLIKVRKEYIERRNPADEGKGSTAETTNELAEAMDQNPDLAEELRKLVGA